MKNIWQDLPRPFFILAPMEAVTDVVFRHVVKHAAAPDLYFTEFTNATGWAAAGDRAIGGRLVKTDDEKPIIAQLWGSDPDAMAKLAKHCAGLGYHGIDLNMGCPDSSAIKSGSGAGLIRSPEVAAELIKAAKESGLPVSVKTRLGYSRVDEWEEWLGHLLKQDIVNLAIHLRTKKEMSKVPAHFELIPEIKKLRDKVAPQTLLTINGDIEDRAHGLKLAEKTGIDGIMIGRGVFTNPFVFAKPVKRRLMTSFEATKSEEQPETQSPRETVFSNERRQKGELIALLNYHLDMYDMYSEQTKRPFDTLKRFFKIYIRDFEGAAELRDQLMHTKSTDEVRSVLASVSTTQTSNV
ncbi:MAG TPA: tRNA-dihydrouridine synthase [Candidatus Saccharibacteria bacterium]|nr:tRNA-dihydrouridine synthase [Candidatus Saccharibacteria bacterium]HRK94207.1 tRNA-dihydrouridine synthase [Candidatus Saccharibacteria bacterium]